MNASMWLKALRVIPRIDKAEWDALDIISRWLISTRAAVLIMTFISAALAGIFAWRDGSFHLGRWALLVVGLVFAHATNNLINDLTDHKRGVDKNNYFRTQYGPQPLEQGLLTIRSLLVYIAVTGLIAIAAGLPLVIQGGSTALWLMIAGVVFVLFYTFPLKYIGLGEVAVLIIWGPLMIGGGYYVISGAWDWNVVWASLPYALGPTTVLFGKHIDKLAADKAKRIYTMPVILGEKVARYTVLGMIALQYLTIIALVITGFFTPVMLIVLAALTAIPRVWAIYKAPKPENRPPEYDPSIWPLWFSAISFFHNRRYGMFLMLGLILEVILRLWIL
ncbi:MAG: prenyltransferase [Chloroflexi bacterium HGW-Chloroflexi-2]|jgi:1,4-dihydroxy-2-naphthoate octaprenyltransferase|nr:MAG: prenyltransferase [Chloroflexi bacterium HGW-Chloroflexi-2]